MDKNVKWFSRIELNKEIWKYVKSADTVLDIGCGLRPQTFFKPDIHYCGEPCEEYYRVLVKKYKNNNSVVVINDTAQNIVKQFGENSVDSIFMLDVIEHLPKADSKKVIKECQKLARKQVIIFTPLGFMKQEYANGEKDAWGLRGQYWQTHKSAWGVQDFDSKWIILVCKHYHYFDTKGNLYDEPQGVFWAIYNKNNSKNMDTSPMISRTRFTDRFIGIGAGLLKTLPRPVSRWMIKIGIVIWHKVDMMIRS